MRDKERWEEEIKYMKVHKYTMIALVILLDAVIRIKTILRKILVKLS
ncbi:hypothetical protein AVU39_gp53 [Sulfolobus monocaudavirus SMV2]|nr:hypothetical protein AVU39_gp53 [Sulfolobus monocaudavirus SMV2]AIZ11387.1 hypothetical protein [Sulfolobus monocaudavirus SMV2]